MNSKYPTIQVRSSQEQIDRCISLAAQAGILHDGQGNRSGFLSHLIRYGQVRSVSEVVDMLQEMDDEQLVFIARLK